MFAELRFVGVKLDDKTFGALNETIKLNVEELLKDPAFIKAIN